MEASRKNITEETPKTPSLENATLDEMFEREEQIVCDYSVCAVDNECWFWRYMYETHRYSELDIGRMQSQINQSENFLSILQHPKTVVPEGVPKEIDTMIRLLHDKEQFFNKQERNHKVDKKRCRWNPEDHACIEKALFEEARNIYYHLHQQARRIRFSPKDRNGYEFLERITMAVAANTHSKIDFSEKYGSIKSQNRQDFHTDEQLAAIAMYGAIFDNSQGAVLTRDSDIRRILINTMRYLTQSERAEARDMGKLVMDKGVKVYHLEDPSQAKVTFSGSLFNPTDYLRVPERVKNAIERNIN